MSDFACLCLGRVVPLGLSFVAPRLPVATGGEWGSGLRPRWRPRWSVVGLGYALSSFADCVCALGGVMRSGACCAAVKGAGLWEAFHRLFRLQGLW